MTIAWLTCHRTLILPVSPKILPWPSVLPVVTVSPGLAVAVRAHGSDEDEAVLPIWSGRMPETDPEKLKWHSARLGGKTLGEELGKWGHSSCGILLVACAEALQYDAYVESREVRLVLGQCLWRASVVRCHACGCSCPAAGLASRTLPQQL
jgi:hypothetical protein